MPLDTPHPRAANPDAGVSVGIASPGSEPGAIVCFSHLRWGFVWQRPQHLLSRFATEMPVFVVEEPEFVPADDAHRLRIESHAGVTVITPLLPLGDAPWWGFNEVTNPAVGALLAPFFADADLLTGGGRRPLAWYYTPMALGAAPSGFAPALVVYDVMDELANFRAAPATLREREAALLAQTDLLFTGGPSLYEGRQGRHHAVHCFPSGVDEAHFARALDGTVAVPELADAARPIVGFYGVIDERLDTDLLAHIADLRPGWTLVMIGPVVKIADEDLPRRPNIRYLGQRGYADLPAYLARFDAAILPFARNDATRFISPTKTLEYMAARKPIVSTPIKDVVDLYGSVVEIAATAPEFVAAIERLWQEPPTARQRRQERTARLLTEHDWDGIAARMRALIATAAAEAAASHPTEISREPVGTASPGAFAR